MHHWTQPEDLTEDIHRTLDKIEAFERSLEAMIYADSDRAPQPTPSQSASLLTDFTIYDNPA